jgi:hypothetical protein
MRPVVREAIIPLLIGGSIGITQLVHHERIESYINKVTELVDRERIEPYIQTITEYLERPSSTLDEQSPIIGPKLRAVTPDDAIMIDRIPFTLDTSIPLREQTPMRRMDLARENASSEPQAHSQLEDIISAWQAAAISRFTIIEPLVEEIAEEFDSDHATIYGIVLSESSAYPDALSSDGKQGLLQHRPETFAAILDLSWHERTPLYDEHLENDVWDPQMSLRAYRIELRAHREYLHLSDPVTIHIIRNAREKVSDVEAYLQSSEAHEHRARVERRIEEAQRLLSFSHDSLEYELMKSTGSIENRLFEQFDRMIALAQSTSGEYRTAYLTNAVSYARVLGLERTLEGALISYEPDTTIGALTHTLNTPLGTR